MDLLSIQIQTNDRVILMRSLYSGIVALSNVFDNKTLFFFFSCNNATVIIYKTIFC